MFQNHWFYYSTVFRPNTSELRFSDGHSPAVTLTVCGRQSHLWPATPVDEDTDGTVGSAATHEQMGPVVRLHHPDEVPTAVLQKTQINKSSEGESRPWKCHSDSLRPNVKPRADFFWCDLSRDNPEDFKVPLLILGRINTQVIKTACK